jgi:hypothetical protein
MIGQDYFDLRSRLGSALFALRGISAESGFGDDQISTIDSLVGGLKDPFLFVVVGEVNVGKSTFLNALFGADLSKTGVMPTTEKIHFFKHGPELLRVPVTRTLEEVQVPVDFLRDFNVVDTPGTNSIENEHQEITERFVPTADLVIFVFSAMNPWGASAWQFLEKVHQQWLRNVMFVLQQSDLREPEEIQSILAYMKRLCAQRFGREFPIFPVSAKRAYLARSSGLDRDRLLAESGFNSLEKYISGVIGGSGSRLGKLTGSLRTARQILGSLQGEFESRTGRRLERAGILRAIDAELADQAQRAFDRLAAVTETASAGVEKVALGARSAIAGELAARGAMQSVLREKRSVDAIEKQVRDAIVGADPERWSRAAVGLEADVVATANQLRTQLAERLEVPAAAEMRFESGFWDEQRRRLLEEVGGIQQRVASGLEIAQGLEPVLRRSRRIAQGQVLVAAVGVAVAIALGVMSGWVAAGCAVVAAALSVFFLGRKNAKLLAEALTQVDSRLSAAPEALKHQLEQHLRGETENLFERFNRAIQPVRESFAEQERRRVLLQWQIENLARTLEGLESELGAGPAPSA